MILCPPAIGANSYRFFFGEGSRKIDVLKKVGTLILSSLLEDLGYSVRSLDTNFVVEKFSRVSEIPLSQHNEDFLEARVATRPQQEECLNSQLMCLFSVCIEYVSVFLIGGLEAGLFGGVKGVVFVSHIRSRKASAP